MYYNDGLERQIDYCFKLKYSLCTQDYCLFFSDRIIVPELLKNKILKKLHKDYEGIIRMNMTVRSVLW